MRGASPSTARLGQKTRPAFTLVELVVVVLILGILAAIAAPRAFQTSTQARDNGLKQSLTAIRDAIDYYKLQNGDLPGSDGVEATFKTDLAPYLRNTTFPACPVGPGHNNSVKMVTDATPLTGDAVPTEGWQYSSTTGEFIVNYSGAAASDPTVNYDEF